MGVGSSYPATLALFFVISMAGRALSRMVWTMSNNWRCPSTYFEIIGHSSTCPWHVFFRFVCRSTESGLSESDSGLTNGSNEDATERERALREKVRTSYPLSPFRFISIDFFSLFIVSKHMFRLGKLHDKTHITINEPPNAKLKVFYTAN